MKFLKVEWELEKRKREKCIEIPSKSRLFCDMNSHKGDQVDVKVKVKVKVEYKFHHTNQNKNNSKKVIQV